MQKSTKKQKLEPSSTPMNVERVNKENSGNKPLIEYEDIPRSPFKLVRHEEKYFIVMGDHRITDPTETKNEQYLKLDKEKWQIIFTTIAVVVSKTLEEQNLYGNKWDYKPKQTRKKLTKNTKGMNI